MIPFHLGRYRNRKSQEGLPCNSDSPWGLDDHVLKWLQTTKMPHNIFSVNDRLYIIFKDDVDSALFRMAFKIHE